MPACDEPAGDTLVFLTLGVWIDQGPQRGVQLGTGIPIATFGEKEGFGRGSTMKAWTPPFSLVVDESEPLRRFVKRIAIRPLDQLGERAG